MDIQKFFRILITVVILAVAGLLGTLLWRHYLYSPWTRDGRVYADVINITSDVAGLVTQMNVKDNQHVKKGDVLFVVDPSRYRIALENANTLVLQRKHDLDLKLRSASRRTAAGDLVVPKDVIDTFNSEAKIAYALYQEALAQQSLAKLNLERTQVRASVDGYVTNLNIHLGDYALTGKPVLALVDQHSFVVLGYFEETKMQGVKLGEPADIQLLGSDRVLKGYVYSIARAIYDRDNTDSPNLLQNVTPTFSWVRLAQRIPVRIHFDQIPEDLLLSAGMTCTVVLHNPSAKAGKATPVQPALTPQPLVNPVPGRN